MTSEFLQGIADAYRTAAGGEEQPPLGDPRHTVQELIALVGQARERVGALAVERERLRAEHENLKALRAAAEAERDDLRTELNGLAARLDELSRCGDELRQALTAAEAAEPAPPDLEPSDPGRRTDFDTDATDPGPELVDADRDGPLRAGELRRSLGPAFSAARGRRRPALTALLGPG